MYYFCKSCFMTTQASFPGPSLHIWVWIPALSSHLALYYSSGWILSFTLSSEQLIRSVPFLSPATLSVSLSLCLSVPLLLLKKKKKTQFSFRPGVLACSICDFLFRGEATTAATTTPSKGRGRGKKKHTHTHCASSRSLRR